VRVGIFGGSFDPPHIGHLLIAVDAFEKLSLDKLIFVPAYVQPLKASSETAPAPHRLAMLQLLIDGDARFDVDAIEIDRGGLSYTVQTLETFAQRFPDAERFFIVGEDAMAAFPAWRNPELILVLAKVAILRRPGAASEKPIFPRDGTIALSTRLVDVSSTEIRQRVRVEKSIRGFVPESVAAFIEAKRLYR
jgi:nicotinate-nucleotide adenylyltransferase